MNKERPVGQQTDSQTNDTKDYEEILKEQKESENMSKGCSEESPLNENGEQQNS